MKRSLAYISVLCGFLVFISMPSLAQDITSTYIEQLKSLKSEISKFVESDRPEKPPLARENNNRYLKRRCIELKSLLDKLDEEISALKSDQSDKNDILRSDEKKEIADQISRLEREKREGVNTRPCITIALNPQVISSSTPNTASQGNEGQDTPKNGNPVAVPEVNNAPDVPPKSNSKTASSPNGGGRANTDHSETTDSNNETRQQNGNGQTNSVNERLIVGLEQAGASSANSETKPFLDLFFTRPLSKGDLPRVSIWGQIRLSTTPEQVGATGAFPSNLVNQVAQTGKTVDLVESFDFLAGLEVKVFSSGGHFPSLAPGKKQKNHFYLLAGGGAINPLTTTKESAQIFKVPSTDSPQRQLFVDRFGADAANKTYVAFVFPERDRFFRQFYAGFRLKTFYYENDNDNKMLNQFPGMLDVMFGQNEAVTGGRLKNDVTDSSGKIIGRKRSYVFRLDGFYPLPIKSASFLYLYGTAMMKIGGGGVRITTPLFLDTAPGDVLVTNKDVFIAPTLQINRDYYKIGIGIDLFDLFNRKPKTDNNKAQQGDQVAQAHRSF
jgi:hypothetical protein